MIKTNLVVGLDEDTVSGESSVVLLKTTEAGNIIIESVLPKCAVSLEDLRKAVDELNIFILMRNNAIEANKKQLTLEFTAV